MVMTEKYIFFAKVEFLIVPKVGSAPSPTQSDGSEDGGQEILPVVPKNKPKKKNAKKKISEAMEKLSISSSTATNTSQSATLMSTHAMKMGLYTINLGTNTGQRLHTCHLIILPLIPVFILLTQNSSTYITNNQAIRDLQDVTLQVSNAIDFARLTRKLQEERVAVALDFFIAGRENITDISQLDRLVATDEASLLDQFILANTFNNTDNALQEVSYWPSLGKVGYLKSKLALQIKHALFRTKIKDGEKSMDEVFTWYNELNGNTLNYVTYSIHDSDISNFYRFIIGYKNLLRTVEFSGRAGILGMEYMATGLNDVKFEQFLEFDILRREYLNQTFNFLPYIQRSYEDYTSKEQTFDQDQDRIKSGVDFDRNIRRTADYFFRFLKYSEKLREMIEGIAGDITVFVTSEIDRLTAENILPMLFIVILILFVPICIIFTLNQCATICITIVVRNDPLSESIQSWTPQKVHLQPLSRNVKLKLSVNCVKIVSRS